VVTFNPERSGALGFEPLGGGDQRGLLFNCYAGTANLLPCLLGVAAVGEEHRLLGAHQQGSSAAGKSAEIADVGQVGNQEIVHAKFRKRTGQGMKTLRGSRQGE